MSAFNRRDFLRSSGSAGLLAAVGSAAAWADSAERNVAPIAESASAARPVLLLVTLYGGNDGLNTVVPHADSTYRRLRAGLAYSTGEVATLSPELGLNKAMTSMTASWKAKQLAVINGVGYAGMTGNHARSMRVWQTGSTDPAATTGWIGRWLDATTPAGTSAVSIGAVAAPLGVGATRSAKSVATAGGAIGLAAQLQTVARLITTGSTASVYNVSMGGFDTHTGGRAVQQERLSILDRALAAFDSSIAGSSRAADVITVVYSEFGRRLQPNGNGGTDHGTAGPVLIRGAKVKGGLYGEQPALAKYAAVGTPVTVDFRAVYGELLQRALFVDPYEVLQRNDKLIGFLR